MAKKSKMKRKSNGKTAASRTTARSAKKTSRTASKTAAKKIATPMKLPSFREPLSKSTMIKTITDVTCLGKKDVVAVLDCLTEIIEKHVKPGGAGTFVMPGLMKINVVKKPARAARKGINPFTGEEIMIKARPAYKAVKIKALKKLKEMVAA
jgi:nucleoid DNA-binding protein